MSAITKKCVAMISTSACAGLCIFGAVGKAAPDDNRSIDFNRVNAALSRAAAITERGTTQIQVSFDPRVSDVSKDRYLRHVSLKLNKTAWSQTPANLSAALFVQASKKSSENEKPLVLKGALRLDTEPIAFIRHLASSGTCNEGRSQTGIRKVLGKEHCATRAKLKNVQSMAELVPIYREQSASQKKHLEEFIKASRDEASRIQSQIVREQVEEDARNAEALLKTANSFQMTQTSNGFRISMGSPRTGDQLDIQELVWDLTPRSISLAFSAKTKLGEKLYWAMKPELVKYFKALEANEDYAIKIAQMRANVLGRLLESVMDNAGSQLPATGANPPAVARDLGLLSELAMIQ